LLPPVFRLFFPVVAGLMPALCCLLPNACRLFYILRETDFGRVTRSGHIFDSLYMKKALSRRPQIT